MDADALRDLCLGFTGAVEERPFGPETSTFKVSGKIFAISALDRQPLDVSLKCEPELSEQLRATYPEIIPGYHLDKRHWNTLKLDGSLPDDDGPRPRRGLLRPRGGRPAQAGAG